MTVDFFLLLPQAAILITSASRATSNERAPCTEIVRGQLASSALPQDPRPREAAVNCQTMLKRLASTISVPPPPPQRTITYAIYHTPYSIYTKLNSSVPSFSLAIFIVFLSLCAHFIFEFGFLPALPSLWIGLLCLGLLSVWFVSSMFCLVLCADKTIIIELAKREEREKSGVSKLLVVNKLLLVLLFFNSQRAITANLVQLLTLHYFAIPCNCALII